MDDLLQEFIAETRETLEALSGEIVAWEAEPGDRARLDAIFRFVHTVKGSCGFLDLPRLARLSHAAEDVLAAVRDGKRAPDTQLVNAVLAIVDRIGEIVEAIDAGAALDDSGEDMLVAALEAKALAVGVPAAQPVQRAPTRSVRLSVDLLDRMMSGMSDMVLARNELARRIRDDTRESPLESALERLSATVAEMRDTVTRTRMQKIEALFSALPRMVRDTAAGVGKAVALTIDGADVELDREMIEMMRDPLVHMVRNAIDHGIETPADRRAAGKRETGRLTISARQSGNRILVEIADDGRGIDTARLVAKLIARDPHRAAELNALGERARLDLIFEPGLSARDHVTSLSGRGVGMDVVRANVEQIGGRIELASKPGQGLVVSIEVPLTLAILSAVIVSVGGQRFAVPRQAIEEIVATHGDAIQIDALGGTQVASVRDRRMALVDLGGILSLRGDAARAPAMLMVVEVPGGVYALAIDAVHDTEELVVKPAAPSVMAAGIYAGQTLPDSGLPMLLLDCAGIAAAAGLRFERTVAVEPVDPVAIDPGIAALLFDDVDGMRRAMVLDAIDRVELVPVDAIRMLAGRLRMTVDGAIVPLVVVGAIADRGEIPVLRLHDDRGAIGYAIGEAIDIVHFHGPLAPPDRPGAIVGVVVIDGEPVELVDPLWLLDEAARGVRSDRPVCLIQGGETAWMESFLRPVIEGAGYRVVKRLAPGDIADICLAMDDDAIQPGLATRTLKLSRDQKGALYRYDRAAVLAALGGVDTVRCAS